MLPWTRPEPHEDFEYDGSELLAAIRRDIAAGKPNREVFKNREIWSGTWKRGHQPPGLHKVKLAEPLGVLAKCVWCEQLRPLARELDVEHYRPKAGVSEWQGDPSPVSDVPPREFPIASRGYWWLAVRWNNFTLACKTCNQSWKRNLFPVSERLSCQEGVEMQERPLLLDPATDFHTADHFRWDEYSGIVEGISIEGRATIITCGLNRTSLLTRRGKTARETAHAAEDLLRAFRRNDREIELNRASDLRRLGSSNEEFTSMTRWVIEQKLGITWNELPFTDPSS